MSCENYHKVTRVNGVLGGKTVEATRVGKSTGQLENYNTARTIDNLIRSKLLFVNTNTIASGEKTCYKVVSVDEGLLRSGNVTAGDDTKSKYNYIPTNKTIEQLISDNRLFVKEDEGTHTSSQNNDKLRKDFYGGGKRNKSRKPKRRNSRSNRTLNKSKK